MNSPNPQAEAQRKFLREAMQLALQDRVRSGRHGGDALP